MYPQYYYILGQHEIKWTVCIKAQETQSSYGVHATDGLAVIWKTPYRKREIKRATLSMIALSHIRLAALVILAIASGVSLARRPVQQHPDEQQTTIIVPNRPNVIFILTDDQDAHLDSLSYQPLVKKHLIDNGLTFRHHYCTVAICCPSRVNLWTGLAAHNTNVTDVTPPYGEISLRYCK